MQINSSFNTPNFIGQNKNENASILDKIAATRELSGKDSADLIVANGLSSQISSATQELQNANESVAVLQIADGALNSISENTFRMEELSVAYNSGVLNASQRNALTEEFQALQQVSNDILQDTSYNGQRLFGDSSPMQLGDVKVDGATIADQESVTALQAQVGTLRSDVGSAMQREEVGINNLLASISNTTASYAGISEQPFDQKIADLQASNLQLNASILAQSHNTQTIQKQMSMLLSF